MSPLSRDKDVVWDSIRGFAQVHIEMKSIALKLSTNLICSLCMGLIGCKRSSACEKPGGAVSKPEEMCQKWLGFVHRTEKNSAGRLPKEHVQLGIDLILYLVGSQKYLRCLLCGYYHRNLSHFS